MPLSFQKRLQNLADEYQLDGDKQCAVSSYLIRHSSLFEHLDTAEAKSLYSSLTSGDTEKIIQTAISEWGEGESVQTYEHEEVHVSDEGRKQRALILDAKLEDALLESYQYMAEIIDEKLYKELGYDNAREYFQAKQISVGQAYTYAMIGRKYKPYLSDPKNKETLLKLGTSKIGEIARNLDDQIPALMAGDTIKLGDEEYTAEDLKEFTVREVREEIKKANKRIEDYEVIQEQKKNAELERDQLKKENQEIKELERKYRDRSETEDKIEEDLERAEKAFNDFQTALTRIDETAVPERMEFRLVALIDMIMVADENFREKFLDLMYKHNDVV